MELLIKNIRACDPQTGLDGITDIGIDGGKIVSLGTVSYTHLTLPTNSRV